MMNVSKTDESVSTETLSDNSQDTTPVDVLPTSGTPLHKWFTCCIPKNEVEREEEEEAVADSLKKTPRVAFNLPPVDAIEVDDEEMSEDSVEVLMDEPIIKSMPTLLDAGVLCSIAVLGGILASQALALASV